MKCYYKTVIVLMILSCLFLPAGCRKKTPQPSDQKTKTQPQPAQDQEEKSAIAQPDVLRLLVWEGYAPKKYVEEFEKHIEAKYVRKVKIEISFVGGSDDFFAPVRNKKVDLVTISHHLFKDERFNYIGKQMLVPIDLKNIPNHKHVIPALQKVEYHLSDSEVFGIPICQGPYGLAYNTEKFEQAPTSWDILWAPEFKDKYVIGAEEYVYNANITALALGYPRGSISSFDALNNNEFKDKLRQLVVNAHSFWVGQDEADDLSGLSLAAVWGDSLGTLKKRGQVWKIAEPTEGTSCWVDEYAITWALADKPFLKKIAEEWINCLLTPEYQVDYIVRELTLGPITTNIGDMLTPEEKERLHIGIPNFFSENRILQHTYSQRDRNGIKLLWEEAMRGIVVEKEK